MAERDNQALLEYVEEITSSASPTKVSSPSLQLNDLKVRARMRTSSHLECSRQLDFAGIERTADEKRRGIEKEWQKSSEMNT